MLTTKTKRAAVKKKAKQPGRAQVAKDIFCNNCRFFCAGEGECRRHAPLPRFSADLAKDSTYLIKDEDGDGTDHDYNRAAWPEVRERDWCGEFQEAADET